MYNCSFDMSLITVMEYLAFVITTTTVHKEIHQEPVCAKHVICLDLSLKNLSP